jgi:hypothetical protein
LAVGNPIEEFLLQPVAPKEEPLRVAGRTEISALAGERDKKFRATALAVDATEARLENPAVQKLANDLRNTAMERSVEIAKSLLVHLEKPLVVILEDPVQGRRFGTPGTVDGGRTHRVPRASGFVPGTLCARCDGAEGGCDHGWVERESDVFSRPSRVATRDGYLRNPPRFGNLGINRVARASRRSTGNVANAALYRAVAERG